MAEQAQKSLVAVVGHPLGNSAQLGKRGCPESEVETLPWLTTQLPIVRR